MMKQRLTISPVATSTVSIRHAHLSQKQIDPRPGILAETIALSMRLSQSQAVVKSSYFKTASRSKQMKLTMSWLLRMEEVKQEALRIQIITLKRNIQFSI